MRPQNLVLHLENLKKTRVSFHLPQGSLLLANDKQKVYSKEIIGEIKKDANLILEEDRKDISSEINGEVYFPSVGIKNFEDNFVSDKANLIWVLQGNVYSFPKINNFISKVGSTLTKNTILTFGSISNKVTFKIVVVLDVRLEPRICLTQHEALGSSRVNWQRRGPIRSLCGVQAA